MTRAPLSALALALLACLGCPPSNGDAPATPSGKPGPIDVTSGAYTETTVAAVKKGKPTILADMLPEAQRLDGFVPAAQQAYLRKRALMLASAAAQTEESFAGKTNYVVRMILLNSLDEYGNPQWVGAPELAKLEFTLPAELPDLMAIEDAALEAHFTSATFDLEAIGPALRAKRNAPASAAASPSDESPAGAE